MNKTYHPRGKLVHGFKVGQHPLYSVWAGMKSRCNDSSIPFYKNYGGRGIKYCKRWEDFENFAIDMWPKPKGLSLERKNNNKGYSPNNCVWANREQQSRNRRRFINNTTGHTGIVVCNTARGGFNARYDIGKQRFDLGCFDTIEEAIKQRKRFIKLFETNNERYKTMISDGNARRNYRDPNKILTRRLRRDSSTGIKGITTHCDGYIVRKYVNKERIYLGFRKTLIAAKQLLESVQ